MKYLLDNPGRQARRDLNAPSRYRDASKSKGCLLGFILIQSVVQNTIAQQITCFPTDKQSVQDKTIEINGLLANDFGKISLKYKLSLP